MFETLRLPTTKVPRSRNSDGSKFSISSRRPRNATPSCRSCSRPYAMAALSVVNKRPRLGCGQMQRLPDQLLQPCRASHPQPTPCKHFPGINTLPSPPSLYYKHRFQSASVACNPVARRSVTRRLRMRRCQLRLLPPDNTGMKSALKVYGGMQRQSYREGAHRLRAVDMKQPHCHILRSDTMCLL